MIEILVKSMVVEYLAKLSFFKACIYQTFIRTGKKMVEGRSFFKTKRILSDIKNNE